MTALMALLGGGLGGGLLLVALSLWPRERRHVASPGFHLPRDLPARLARAGGGGVLAALLTRWPVGALGGMAFGFFASDLFGRRADRSAGTDRTEAIAGWTEMLRDTMAAAAGLEQAIISTAPISPAPIRPHIQALVARLHRERLVAALVQLADDMADPTMDLVVSALCLAATGEAQDLAELLGSLAAAARDSATMRLKIDASRARTRTSVRIITGVTLTMALLLVLLNRTYLRPFDSAVGQSVLLLVFACFGTALWWLASMSRYAEPERFLARPTGDAGWS
jgi:Flp pilus assembly protein TadB